MQWAAEVAGGGLGITVDHDAERIVARIWGELDMATTPALRGWLDTALAASPHAGLVLDCTQLSFCDSVGVTLLVQVAGARPGGTAVTLLPSANLQRVIDIVDIGGLFDGDAPGFPRTGESSAVHDA